MAKNEKIQGNNLMKIEKIQGKMTGARFAMIRMDVKNSAFFFISKVEKSGNPYYTRIEFVKDKGLWKKGTT